MASAEHLTKRERGIARFFSGEGSDVTLTVFNATTTRVYNVHKRYLKYSDEFRLDFHKYEACAHITASIREQQPEAITELLRYMYTGEYHTLTYNADNGYPSSLSAVAKDVMTHVKLYYLGWRMGMDRLVDDAQISVDMIHWDDYEEDWMVVLKYTFEQARQHGWNDKGMSWPCRYLLQKVFDEVVEEAGMDSEEFRQFKAECPQIVKALEKMKRDSEVQELLADVLEDMAIYAARSALDDIADAADSDEEVVAATFEAAADHSGDNDDDDNEDEDSEDDSEASERLREVGDIWNVYRLYPLRRRRTEPQATGFQTDKENKRPLVLPARVRNIDRSNRFATGLASSSDNDEEAALIE